MKNQIEVRASSVQKSLCPGETALMERGDRRRRKGISGSCFSGTQSENAADCHICGALSGIRIIKKTSEEDQKR